MKGDRVRVITGTLYETDEALVYVYNVRLDGEGRPIKAEDGSVQIESLGGVRSGTTGVIIGHPEKAHRAQLKDAAQPAGGLGAKDLVEVVPVMLDSYQRLGWFPANNVRVMAGGTIDNPQ